MDSGNGFRFSEDCLRLDSIELLEKSCMKSIDILSYSSHVSINNQRREETGSDFPQHVWIKYIF